MFEKPCGYKNTHTSEIIKKTNNNSQTKFNDELDNIIELFKNSFSSYFNCFK